MISTEAKKMCLPDLTSMTKIKRSMKELINEYQIAHFTIQKKLSDMLQTADESEIVIIRLKRKKLNEEYEQTLVNLKKLLVN